MPLIDITMNPGYRMKLTDGTFASLGVPRLTIKSELSSALPGLLVKHAEVLGLDADTQAEGIQVMNHDYGEYDVNIANLWIKVQFSENTPEHLQRLEIRDTLYDIIVNWFTDRDVVLEDFVLDLFWGPTNGKGTVNGVEIVW